MVNICSINAVIPQPFIERNVNSFLIELHTQRGAIGYLTIGVRKCRRHKPQSFDNKLNESFRRRKIFSLFRRISPIRKPMTEASCLLCRSSSSHGRKE